jgi:hypothetical protein
MMALKQMNYFMVTFLYWSYPYDFNNLPWFQWRDRLTGGWGK